VNDTDSVVDAGDDSTEAVIQLDKELMELAKALPRDNDPTAEAQMIQQAPSRRAIPRISTIWKHRASAKSTRWRSRKILMTTTPNSCRSESNP
jgi:hypothetical protein